MGFINGLAYALSLSFPEHEQSEYYRSICDYFSQNAQTIRDGYNSLPDFMKSFICQYVDVRALSEIIGGKNG